MIDGRALLKKYIVVKLREKGGVIGGDDVDSLMTSFGLSGDEVSKTQFRDAWRSLEYNDRKINTIRSHRYPGGREGVSDYPVRGYTIKLRNG